MIPFMGDGTVFGPGGEEHHYRYSIPKEHQGKPIMPLLFGKLLVLSVATVVTVGIALALGAILHEIEESDERARRHAV